jgi:cell division protein FtsB
MAKALIGFLDSDLRTPSRLTTENARLRARVADLESLVRRLKEENEALTTAHAAALLEAEQLSDLQPV